MQSARVSSQPPRLRFTSWLVAAAVLLCVLFAGNAHLVSGKKAPQWDAVDFFGPQFTLVADHIRSGRLLLWDPWVDAGSPDFAEPELGTTSPVLLLVAFLSSNLHVGFVAYWMVIWSVGGLGFLFLARHLGTPPWGALIAGLGFVSSGFYTGHAEHTSSLWSVSMLPWVLWRFDAALLNRRFWFAVQAGACYGLSALGGYPQFTILTPIFLGLWACGRLFFHAPQAGVQARRRSHPVLIAAALVLVTVSLGAAIFSPSYTAIVTGTRGFSDRVGYRSRLEAVSSNILPVPAFSTVASPYLPLLDLPPNGIWPESDVAMSSVYMGAAVLVLSLSAFWRKDGWRWWLLGMAAFFFSCSVGRQLPVRGWLYDILPPTRFFRNASMFSVYAMFLLAVLACLGARDIATFREKSQKAWLCAVSVFFACAIPALFLHVAHGSGRTLSYYPDAKLQVFLVWTGIAVISLAFYKGILSKSNAAGLLVCLALADAIFTFHISEPIMYTEATVPWWHIMNRSHEANLDLTANGLVRSVTPPESLAVYANNRNLPLKIPVLNSYVTFRNRFVEQMDADPSLRQIATGSNRMWFCSEAVAGAPNDASFADFSKRMHEFGKPVLIVHTPEEMKALALRTELQTGKAAAAAELKGLPVCSQAALSQLSYRPNWLSFRYNAPSQGWLLITDRWASGWKLSVNGKPRPLLGGDFMFRAVRVERGDNQIVFKYRPSGFFVALAVSWTALIAVLIAQLYFLLRNTPRRQKSEFEPAVAYASSNSPSASGSTSSFRATQT